MEEYDVNRFFLSARNIELSLRKKFAYVDSLESLLAGLPAQLMRGERSLDLGCGATPKNPFQADEVHGVDMRSIPDQSIVQADLSIESIPFQDCYFDYCTAFDFIEHVPRSVWVDGKCKNGFIELMNDVYRVLKPGGLFMHMTPSYPAKEAFQDPTHVNVITEDTFPDYFCEPKSWAKTTGYGLKESFVLVDQRWLGNVWVVGIMRKPS